MKRAAVCIGVNRAGSMTHLQGAASGARKFEKWADKQGCDTTLLVDDGQSNVTLAEVFAAVKKYVDPGTYSLLIVYFSGHGILSAPGTEFWLLSGSPENPNEAVNLLRSIEDSRNSGIPHVIFVSDACRSAVKGPPLSAVTGGVIFPNQGRAITRGEIDKYYATFPGDPAYEVPESEAVKRYDGIFTKSLLEAVETPITALVEEIRDGAIERMVITSRSLKPYLESTVPLKAGAVDVKLRQVPELQVESALPKFFAQVDPKLVGKPEERVMLGAETPLPIYQSLVRTLSIENIVDETRNQVPAIDDFLRSEEKKNEVEFLFGTRGRASFETRTGFSIFGSKPTDVFCSAGSADPPFQEIGSTAWHIRLRSADNTSTAANVIFEFESETGTILPVIPAFIGTVVVEQGRVVSVNYVPSQGNPLFGEYLQRVNDLERMKALATVAARHGRFVIEGDNVQEIAEDIRQGKNLDPVMGVLAAYAYAQVGRYDGAHSVFKYMANGFPRIPVPFDVAMLASRSARFSPADKRNKIAPVVPMLSQGWALLQKGDVFYRKIHDVIRPFLVPALWTTITSEGVSRAKAHLRKRKRR